MKLFSSMFLSHSSFVHCQSESSGRITLTVWNLMLAFSQILFQQGFWSYACDSLSLHLYLIWWPWPFFKGTWELNHVLRWKLFWLCFVFVMCFLPVHHCLQQTKSALPRLSVDSVPGLHLIMIWSCFDSCFVSWCIITRQSTKKVSVYYWLC